VNSGRAIRVKTSWAMRSPGHTRKPSPAEFCVRGTANHFFASKARIATTKAPIIAIV
jgi:hypothetical protein